jgi:hypothetical protein
MEERMFKVGDKVRFIDTNVSLILDRNKIYAVEEVATNTGQTTIKLEGRYFESNRFVLCEEKPNTVDEQVMETKLIMTLPTDSATRKEYPLMAGCLRYFPAALAGVALTSKRGNDKHNPGEELHHARGKSVDHDDCILRHLMDSQDLIAGLERGQNVESSRILEEVNQMTWRALAYSQELHERFGAPLAPGAKK